MTALDVQVLMVGEDTCTSCTWLGDLFYETENDDIGYGVEKLFENHI